MLELENILLAALTQAGMRADRALPSEVIARVSEPVCALRLEELEGTDGSLFHYYGMLEDPLLGPKELYGRRFDAVLRLTICAPERAACDQTVETALKTLEELEGLNVQSYQLSEMSWDDESASCQRVLRLRVSGILYFLDTEEDGEFLDFFLLPRVR
ncbi:MAG: hypothetical protein IKS29_07160 [Oscillospiraceae bacterium]|nr:hypothetical protein [Oscillospiraceae bacterium]